MGKFKSMKLFFFLACIVWLSLVPSSSMAHGDLDERILSVTQEISSTPDSAFLYYKRGKLYFHHEDFQFAIDDLCVSRSKGYNDTMQDLLLAKSYLSIDNLIDAKVECNSIKSKSPNNIHANKVLAKIFIREHKYAEAALLYEDVIDHAFKVFPENYFSAADAWHAEGSAKSIDRALQVLYQGINKEGPLLNFYNKIKSLQLEKRDFEAGIQTQLQIIDLSDRKEKVYYELANIYSQSTEYNLAIKYYDKAIIELKKLPLRLQHNKAMKDLESSIRASLTSINELQNSK